MTLSFADCLFLYATIPFLYLFLSSDKMASKVGRALIGGNWKCNGTLSQVNTMMETLNSAGTLSSKSEVYVIII